MITSLTQVLTDARSGHYAVPGFDFTEDVMVRAILETATALRSPVILMCIEWDLYSGEGVGWFYQAGLVRAVADCYDIPVVLHYDHGTTIEGVQKAIDHGFTSVMIDGSSLPFDENVALTAKVVEMARPHGISVEAELGFVGGFNLQATEHKENVLTDPTEAAEFVRQTGADALAVSIGTAHGVYRSEPTLNILRLKELREAVPVPLVLHGGSGTPEDQVREAICHGICKMNVYADVRQAMCQGLKRSATMQERPDPEPDALSQPINEAIGDAVTDKIKLCGSDGKV